MIAIIDYDAGNIRSVEKALLSLGEEVILTRDPKTLLEAERVILPGVGAFGDAMGRLEEYGLVEIIRRIVDKGTPFLGICLGLQLLFESSEESPGVAGIGILKGKILRIPEGTGEDNMPLKIPHIGWNSLDFTKKGRLFENMPREPYVYFVHSYYLKAEEDIVTARTSYGVSIDASVEKRNVFACQFHPEKSSETGLQILKNFVGIGR
ncbi:MAG: imidazole glycerol phosphate synthase subunit HisH [Eubacteriales bacterium]|nr:imidazole glycerol phosphate synthase subunit HisH [Eubacteriales bacterium]